MHLLLNNYANYFVPKNLNDYLEYWKKIQQNVPMMVNN